MSEQKLQNIVLLRPFIVLLIIVNHCFAVYSGVWSSPWDFEPNVPVYKWIQRFSICCTLQLFTFISGYLYAYQSSLGKNKEFNKLVRKKLQRLILPCLVFGVIYYVIRIPFDEMNVISFLKDMNNGMGHLWFLPMLFWCFIIAYAIDRINEKLKINRWIFLLCLFALSVLSPSIPDYIGLRKACMYFVYFYFGMIYCNMTLSSSCLEYEKFNLKKVIIICLSYLVFFGLYYYFMDNKTIISTSKIYYILFKIIGFLTFIIGIMSFMCLSTYISDNIKVPDIIVKLSGYSFGIYIFQQMIIDVLYYRTTLPVILGVYWLPIVILPITIALSILMTFVIGQTKIGKFLLG